MTASNNSSAAAESRCVLGIDIGAGSLKTTVVDAMGRERGSASGAFSTSVPHPGWSEQDPEDWWRALCLTVPQALANAGLTPGDVRAVSFSAGAHTPVLTDSSNRLLRPAIMWNDQRSSAEARELQDRYGDRILAIGLNRAAPTWTMPQLLWLRRNEPAVADAVRRVYVAKDWLRMKLCDQWHTDVTDAVGTLLWDHAARCWSDELCGMIDWDIRTLPPSCPGFGYRRHGHGGGQPGMRSDRRHMGGVRHVRHFCGVVRCWIGRSRGGRRQAGHCWYREHHRLASPGSSHADQLPVCHPGSLVHDHRHQWLRVGPPLAARQIFPPRRGQRKRCVCTHGPVGW